MVLEFGGKTRFVILAIGLCMIICTHGNYTTISFTVICMQDVVEMQKVGNETHWLESSSDTSLVFSAGAIGAISGIIPSVPLTTRFGIRKVLAFYSFLSVSATLLIPTAIGIGYHAVLAIRVVQGFGSSILFSSIGCISEGWSPLSEISTYIAILSTGFQLANILTMPTSGYLCESSLGWRSIYYIYGGIALIVNSMFFLFFRDSAVVHKNVGSIELAKITKGRQPMGNRRVVPYKAILKDRTVLAIWASAIGGNMSLMTLIVYGPIYLNKVIGLDIRNTGIANAIPHILAAFVKFVAGPLSDHLTVIPDVWRMIMFASISQGGMVAGFFVMAMTRSKTIAQIAYTTSIVLAGINMVGVVKCAQLVTRQYIQFVMAVNSLISWISIFILPIIIGVLCPNHTPDEWAVFYIGVGCWVILMNIPFPFFATDQPAEYTKPKVVKDVK